MMGEYSIVSRDENGMPTRITPVVTDDQFDKLVSTVAELAGLVATLTRQHVQLQDEFVRLQDQVEGMRQINGLWDGS